MSSTTPSNRPRSSLPLAALVAVASAVVALAFAGGYAAQAQSGQESHSAQSRGLSEQRLALHDKMRRLWEDHITWTRLFIVSATDELPDTAATTRRLLRNQDDIGNAIKPFYGRAAGERLTALLKEHIAIAAELVGAAKSGDQADVERYSAAWYRNANRIAGFLSRANPRHWPRRDMRSMMRDHLDLTLAEAVAHLERDHRADIRAYDRVHRQILTMADMLSDGIAAQFPNRFR
jgi:hypothetical protein